MINQIKSKYIIFLVLVCFAVGQGLGLFTQKIELENSLRDKIYSELGRVINKSRFVVVVNLDLGLHSDLVADPRSGIKGDENSYTSSSRMKYLPGVPLSGTKNNERNNNKRYKTYPIGSDEYIISKVDVAIYIDEKLASGANEMMIESLIQDIMPETASCNDCVRIETMAFTESQEESEIAKLKAQVDEMKENDRKREIRDLNAELELLRAELEDSETEQIDWVNYIRIQDSLKLARLEESEEIARNKLDTVINARIDSETKTKEDLIDIIKYKNNIPTGEDDDLFGMQVPRSSSANTMLILGIALVLLIMLAFILFYRNSGQPIYLKPKDNTASDNEESSTSNEQNTKKVEKVESTNPHSMMNQDESVLLSEMKALRQSAVSLSASQKEGATQIIRDWMSDNNSDSESNNESKE
mgnify:CR=1 FL=1